MLTFKYATVLNPYLWGLQSQMLSRFCNLTNKAVRRCIQVNHNFLRSVHVHSTQRLHVNVYQKSPKAPVRIRRISWHAWNSIRIELYAAPLFTVLFFVFPFTKLLCDAKHLRSTMSFSLSLYRCFKCKPATAGYMHRDQAFTYFLGRLPWISPALTREIHVLLPDCHDINMYGVAWVWSIVRKKDLVHMIVNFSEKHRLFSLSQNFLWN